MDRLATPIALALLVLLPIVLWALRRRRSASAIAFSATDLAADVRPTWRVRLRWLPIALRLLTLALVALAIARPQDVSGEVRSSAEGIAIQIIVDRSGSMDEPMTFDGRRVRKIDAVKSVLEDFVVGDDGTLDGRYADMIGLIAFARYADTVCPLVRAPETLVDLASDLDVVQLRAEDGTAIGEALALGAARLQRAEEEVQRLSGSADADFTIKGKIIILLTDGANNAGSIDPIEAARLAEEWGIRVYAIGIGETRTFGGLLGDIRLGGADERALASIAEVTGGAFYRATDGESLREIYRQIDRLETSRIESVEYTNVEERFSPFAIAAAILLGIEVLLGATILRRGS